MRAHGGAAAALTLERLEVMCAYLLGFGLGLGLGLGLGVGLSVGLGLGVRFGLDGARAPLVCMASGLGVGLWAGVRGPTLGVHGVVRRDQP